MGRRAAAGAPADARLRHHGLPRLGARRAPAEARGDERAAARDGSDAQFRPVQSRPADLCGAEARRHRAAVRAARVRLSSPRKRDPVPPVCRSMQACVTGSPAFAGDDSQSQRKNTNSVSSYLRRSSSVESVRRHEAGVGRFLDHDQRVSASASRRRAPRPALSRPGPCHRADRGRRARTAHADAPARAWWRRGGRCG